MIFLFSGLLIGCVKYKISLSPFYDVLLISIISFFIQAVFITYIGLNKDERVFFFQLLRNKIFKKIILRFQSKNRY